jgi:hypothetical protein
MHGPTNVQFNKLQFSYKIMVLNNNNTGSSGHKEINMWSITNITDTQNNSQCDWIVVTNTIYFSMAVTVIKSERNADHVSKCASGCLPSKE